MDRKISVCIPTFNRYELLIKAIENVIDDSRISEVVIVDDCSTNGDYEKLISYYTNIQKVKLYRNEKNLDCYRNKHEAMSMATEDWCILFDSDNILTLNYLDTIYGISEWDVSTSYQPVFSRPHFDFRNYSGLTLNNKNVSQFVNTPIMTALNAMNFFINRTEYLSVWDGSVDPVTSDSIYFNYCWLKRGNKIHMLPGLEYDHLIHSGSHYQNNVNRTQKGFHNSIINNLKNLK